jgi:hypothetical protein
VISSNYRNRSVYYAVRTGPLTRADYVSFFKGLNRINNANSRSNNHFYNGNAAATSVRIDDVHVTVNKMLLCRIYCAGKNIKLT